MGQQSSAALVIMPDIAQEQLIEPEGELSWVGMNRVHQPLRIQHAGTEHRAQRQNRTGRERFGKAAGRVEQTEEGKPEEEKAKEPEKAEEPEKTEEPKGDEPKTDEPKTDDPKGDG